MKKWIFVAIALAAAGCRAQVGEGPGEGKEGEPEGEVVPVELPGLKLFGDCDGLSAFLGERIRTSEPGRVRPLPTPLVDSAEPATGFNEEGAAPAAAERASSVEQGDIVKRDGDRLYVLASFSAASGLAINTKLFIYDISNPDLPKLLGETGLPVTAREIFPDDRRVIVVGNVHPHGHDVASGVTARLAIVDLAKPSAPVVSKVWDFRGYYENSRKIGSAVYLVVGSAIDPGKLSDEIRVKTDCASSYAPEDLDGGSLKIWSVVGVDLDAPEKKPAKVSMVASYGLSEIHVTPERFYLADYSFEKDRTGIFAFDLGLKNASIKARASGKAPGRFVNQFSMDEHKGFFRIATTGWEGRDERDDLEWRLRNGNVRNYLTIFEDRKGRLEVVGQIDSITPNETLTAARFLGDRAFLSTAIVFNDPLIAVDLSDPRSPKIVAELEVPGVTNHLHAWGDRLIAVGTAGRGWWGGEVVLTLFDVSDPEHPKAVQQYTVENASSSEAQSDHRAFSFFEDRGVLAIPLDGDWAPCGGYPGSRIGLFGVDASSGFSALGGITHDDLAGDGAYSPRMRRSFEIGDRLYTVSEAGLKVSSFKDLGTLHGEVFPGFEVPLWARASETEAPSEMMTGCVMK